MRTIVIFLFDFISELFKLDTSDPFDGMGEPCFRNVYMSDDDYRDYIRGTNANNLAGIYNHCTGMFDNGCDLFGYYDDDYD